MSTTDRQTKVEQIIKNADLYDLIKISMRSSDSKVSAVDRYIKRALERQTNQHISNGENKEPYVATPVVAVKQTDTLHKRVPTDKTDILRVESPINQENRYLQKKASNHSSPININIQRQYVQISMQNSPLRQPFQETQQVEIYSQNVSILQEFKNSPDRHPYQYSQASPAKRSPFKENQNIDEAIPSPKRDKPPTPLTKNLRAPVLSDCGESVSTNTQQEILSSRTIESTVLSRNGKKDTTPCRTLGNFAKQTVSSQYKVRDQQTDQSLTSEVSMATTKQRQTETMYQSRTSGLYTSVSGVNLGRSVSTNSIVAQAIDKRASACVQKALAGVGLNKRKSSLSNNQRLESNKSAVCSSETNDQSNYSQSSNLTNLKKQHKKTHQEAYEELVQKQVQKVTKQFLPKPVSMKQRVINSFTPLNLGVFVEIERIKKPQKLPFQVGKMLCLLVNAFRDKPVREEFDSWPKIQYFINYNVNKFTQEVLSIKTKSLEKSHLYPLDAFRNIHNEFFQGNSMQVFQNHIANKSLQAIVTFVYNVVEYILNKDEDLFQEDISQVQMENQSLSDAGQYLPAVVHEETPKLQKRQLNNMRAQISTSPIGTLSQRELNIIGNHPCSTRVLQSKHVLKPAISPKPRFTATAVQLGQSPFRQPTKNKFTKAVEHIEKKHNFNSNIVNRPSQSRTPPKREREPIVQTKNRSHTPLDKFETQRSQLGSRTSLLQSNSKLTLKEYSSSKSPVCQSSTKKQESNTFVKQVESPECRSPHFEESLIEAEKIEFSPQRVKKVELRSDLSQLIIAKSFQIEANMRQVDQQHDKKIDLNIIEELKRRRGQQRLRGEELELKREEIIQQVQKQMFAQDTL